MKNLTEKEIAFIDALKKDLKINGEKSFIEILFKASFTSVKEMKNELDNLFEGYYKKLFNQSNLLLESADCMYIGKYQNTFWGTGSEGEVFGLGQDIQNIVFPIIYAEYGQVTDLEEKKTVCEYFKNNLNLDYDDYIESYRVFCKNLGCEYQEDLELISKQSQNFEIELGNLK